MQRRGEKATDRVRMVQATATLQGKESSGKSRRKAADGVPMVATGEDG